MWVRCQLFTRYLFRSLLCFGLLSLSGAAFAQVYKSYDADGNVVFSDKPTQGSQEVEVTRPNLSDSFEIPPASQDESPPEIPPEAPPEAESQPVAEEASADTNNDGRVSRREKEEWRKLQRQKKREMEKAAAGDEDS